VFGLVIADITSIQWRGFVNGVASLPFIVNAFVASDISSAISLENWRWGVSHTRWIPLVQNAYLSLVDSLSTECSLSSFLPVSSRSSRFSSGLTGKRRNLEVSLTLLLTRIDCTEQKTRHQPIALSPVSSDIAHRRQQGSDEPRKPFVRAAMEYLDKMDAFGLLLLTFAWCLMLLPFTLSASADNGYKNRELKICAERVRCI
jgi:hypothetical protein